MLPEQTIFVNAEPTISLRERSWVDDSAAEPAAPEVENHPSGPVAGPGLWPSRASALWPQSGSQEVGKQEIDIAAEHRS